MAARRLQGHSRRDEPGSLQEGQLTDPALEQFLVNGAIGEFQYAYGYYALWSAVMADEAFTDHTNVGIRELSLHNFNDLNDTNQGVFENLSRARASADDALDRLKTFSAPAPAKSLNVARVLAYGGYSYMLLGEGFCDAPIALSAGLPPAELFKRAISHFDSAITVATASAVGASAANAAAATGYHQHGACRRGPRGAQGGRSRRRRGRTRCSCRTPTRSSRTTPPIPSAKTTSSTPACGPPARGSA